MENKTLWAYIDIDNEAVAWEVAIGRLQSLNFAHTKSLSIWVMNNLRNAVKYEDLDKWKIECELELFRRKEFPNKISRLTGLFFFESEEEAKQNSKSWGEHFSQEYLTDVGFSYQADDISRYDAKWITNYQKGDQNFMRNYFSGIPYDDDPHWEIVAHGRGVIWNLELKQRAYEYLIQIFPRAKVLLQSAITIFRSSVDGPEDPLNLNNEEDIELAYNAGALASFPIIEEGVCTVSYYIDMRAFDKFGIYHGEGDICLSDSSLQSFTIDLSKLKQLGIAYLVENQ